MNQCFFWGILIDGNHHIVLLLYIYIHIYLYIHIYIYTNIISIIVIIIVYIYSKSYIRQPSSVRLFEAVRSKVNETQILEPILEAAEVPGPACSMGIFWEFSWISMGFHGMFIISKKWCSSNFVGFGIEVDFKHHFPRMFRIFFIGFTEI